MRSSLVAIIAVFAAVVPPTSSASSLWWEQGEPGRGSVELFASEVSAQPGDVMSVSVNVPSGSAYRLDVLRLDHSRRGARAVGCAACGRVKMGTAQPPPMLDEGTGAIRAPWRVTHRIRVAPTWTSGYYVVRATIVGGSDAGAFSWTPLIIRRAPTAPPARILVEIPISTWQAYNTWGGKSAYVATDGGRPSDVVSFDRPYEGGLIGWEYPLVRFLERQGYDVDYQTDLDTDRNPRSLLDHRLVIVNGHDEYWTPTTSAAFYTAKAKGVNLAFFGANIGYWRTRLLPDGRSLAIYKRGGDPEHDPARRTGYYRDTHPECQLLGVQHQTGAMNWPDGDYTVDPNGFAHRWFRNTGFRRGDVIDGIVSIEADTVPRWQEIIGETCPSRPVTVLFRRDMGGDTLGDARAVTYVARSGARIFSAGSLNFTWALDDVWQRWLGQPSLVDARLRRFVTQMLDGLSGRQEASSR